MTTARYLEDGYLAQVQRGIDYIESHLDGPLEAVAGKLVASTTARPW